MNHERRTWLSAPPNQLGVCRGRHSTQAPLSSGTLWISFAAAPHRGALRSAGARRGPPPRTTINWSRERPAASGWSAENIAALVLSRWGGPASPPCLGACVQLRPSWMSREGREESEGGWNLRVLREAFFPEFLSFKFSHCARNLEPRPVFVTLLR